MPRPRGVGGLMRRWPSLSPTDRFSCSKFWRDRLLFRFPCQTVDYSHNLMPDLRKVTLLILRKAFAPSVTGFLHGSTNRQPSSRNRAAVPKSRTLVWLTEALNQSLGRKLQLMLAGEFRFNNKRCRRQRSWARRPGNRNGSSASARPMSTVSHFAASKPRWLRLA
jgi:hypothetical protein